MGETLRILIVEDNPGDAVLEAEQLKSEGLLFEYLRVETEEEYCRELDRFKPDIILADYRLPRFDGLQALRLVRQKYPFIPLIIVSGALDEEAAIALLREGAVDYILKQSIARLGSAVKNALEVRRAQEEQTLAAEELRAYYRELEQRVKERTHDLSAANEDLKNEIEVRRKAEKALQQSEELARRERELLEKIIDSIPVMIAIYDPDGGKVRVNRELEKSTGWTNEDIRTIDLQKALFPDSAARKAAAERLRPGAGGWSDLTVTAKDGTAIDSLWADIRLPDGREVGIGLDIRERKRIADELKRTAEEYRAVVQGLSVIILRLDTDGKVEFINRFGLEFFGYTEEEVVGKPIVDTILPLRESTGRDLAAMKDDVFRSPGRYAQNENENIKKNGERAWISWTNNALRDREGKMTSILASGIDITYRKRMEDSLRRNEYELKTLVDSSPDIIVRISRDLRYRFVNPAYERITGIPREQFIGKTNGELGMPAEQAAHWEEELRKVFDSGREGSIELEFKSFFGERYFWGRIVPEFAKSGVVETALVIARDITERRRAEEQIRYISFHDPVTGLYNRAYYEEEMRRTDAERSLPISIIMGDVNNLKLTNDTFGHDEGDRLLQRLAAVLRVSCRQTDIIARWGGDEFVVILPKTPLAVAEGIIRRIGEESAKVKELSLPLSIALGVSIKENAEQNIYQVLREAEERMYETKALFGRQNREKVFAALLLRLFERQPSLKEHIGRMKELIGRMAEPLQISSEDVELLCMVSDLHEVGKVAVAGSIWLKRGRFEPQEWEAMKKYIDVSYLVARTFSEFVPCADILQSLDERWDGYGYPRGLQDGATPCLSRLFALFDAFDVMTHDRPYAPTFTIDEAFAELRRCAGKQFDPELTDKFIAALQQQKEPV
jgi:diguanylate cyclase (GGDEF)-like protein/PAS domain S-box-containing protein